MSDLSLPVWSLYPDWTDGVLETLEFLSTVAESPSAIEQRRGLRLTPRQYFEYSYILKGPLRTYFDMLTMRAGGSPVYVPIWHDVELLPYAHAAGSTVLSIDITYTEFMNCNVVMLGGPHDYELVEILGRADTIVTLTSPTIYEWPKGTRAVPLKKCKLDQPPSTVRRTEDIHVARVKFCSIEPNRTDALPPLNNFGLQYILEEDPNEVEDLTYNYERVLSLLDNTTGLPAMSDVTGRVLQQFAWWRRGRAEHHRLRGLFYALDGRRVPVWVPTIYRDFEPVSPLGAGDLAIDVRRCGYTNLGGPGPQREYILIQTLSGNRHYRKVTDSVILDNDTERLFLDSAVGEDIPLNRLNRISFLVLCRLDQDTVEFHHHTATRGMTTTTAVFRSAAAKPGIENLFEVPPGIIPPPLCLSDFDWWAGSPWLGSMIPSQLDAFGNYYVFPGGFARSMLIYNGNGVLVNEVTDTQLFDAINAWFGSDIVQFQRYNGIFMSPLRQGRYVLAHVISNNEIHNFNKWWVLLEPHADGSLTVAGVVYNQNLTGPPYAGGFRVMDVFGDDTCLTVLCYAYLGSTYATMLVLPTINDFLNDTYGSGAHPCRIPTKTLEPIGNKDDLSRNFWALVPNNQNRTFGFRLPGNGRELYYVYVNRFYIEQNLSSAAYACPEIRNVIGPLYPFGFMLKIPLGDIGDFDALPGFRPTGDYVIDNPNWIDQDGGVTIPFSEEYTYLSDGTTGGKDVFSPLVGVQPRSNGHFWIVFVMTGQYDSLHRGTGGSAGMPVYARVRLFDYDPATEIARQVGDHTCELRDAGDGPSASAGTVQNDLYLVPTVVELPDSATIILHGVIYHTTFCTFYFGEE